MSEREHVIDFTVPYYDLVGITIMMKKPKVTDQLINSEYVWVILRGGPVAYSRTVHNFEDLPV